MVHFLNPHAGRVFHARVVLMDSRVKVLLAMGFGVLIWNAGWTGLACYAPALVALLLGLGMHDRARLRNMLMIVTFAGFWSAAMVGLSLWQGVEPHQALVKGGDLGSRLLLLLLLGLGLAGATPPRDLGLALAWGLAPVLRKRAWQAALSLSLMVHFLPQVLDVLTLVRAGIRARAPRRGVWFLPALAAQAVLRVLAQKAWSRTIGLAARGLDSPEAWTPQFQPRPLDWAGGALLLGLGTCVAVL